MKKTEKSDTIKAERPTVFDDVHRTLLERAPELIVPVINEVFHTNYPEDEPVVQLKNEHVDGYDKTITDSCLRIRDKLYHMESQSYRDGSLVIRMLEYDFFIALEHTEKKEGCYRMVFPHSCVLYLRSGKEIPDRLMLTVVFPNGEEIMYEVPVVKMQKYTLQEIFDRKLWFLIPFYLMKYEEELRCGAGECTYDRLMKEYCSICELLPGELSGRSEDRYALLVELMNRIVEYIFPFGEAKERMVEYMGGQVLELEVDKAFDRGCEQGLEQSRTRIYCNMRRYGISREEAQLLAELGDAQAERAEQSLVDGSL